jgi:hypothetical protein
MTTTISAFVLYCKRSWTKRLSFDLTANDGQGGFGSLIAMGLSSSLMSALVAGTGVPVSLLAAGAATPLELGLTLFMMFFVAVSFVLPVYSAHAIIVHSKKKMLGHIGLWYKASLPKFDQIGDGDLLLDRGRVEQLIYTESVFARVLEVNEWPSTFALFGGAINTAIPIAVDLIGRFLKI